MVSIEGVDYSYSRPSAAALKAADKKFAVRYITPPGAGNKGLSQSEFDALRAAGLYVVAVWEGGAGDMKNGKNQGVADAKAALAGLKSINGLNDYLPIYFACDWDATPGDQAAINDYLDGAASVISRERVGIYGGYYPVKRARDAGRAAWLWQTYAWSGGNVLDGIHIYQYKNGVMLGGVSVDLNRALNSEYGQHPVNDPRVAPNPAPLPVPAPVPVPSLPIPEPVPAPTPVPEPDPVPVPQPLPPQVIEPPAPVIEAPAELPVTIPKPNQADLDAISNAKVVTQGFLYIKGDAKPDIYVYNPLTGRKHHVTPSEWIIAQAFGLVNFAVLTQLTVDTIPLDTV